MWVAQCLAFLTILQSTLLNAIYTNTKNSAKLNSTSSNDESKSVEEFCFVQYMDVSIGGEPSIDDTDEVINCVRVRWHRSNGNSQFLHIKEYGLVPVDSVRGVLGKFTMRKCHHLVAKTFI